MGVLGEFGPYLVVFGLFLGILAVFCVPVVRVGKYQAAEARRPRTRTKDTQEAAGPPRRPYFLHTLCVMASLRLKNHFHWRVNREQARRHANEECFV